MPKPLVLRWPPSIAVLCLAALVAVMALVAVGAVDAKPAKAAAGLPKYDHVVIVVEENQNDGDITAGAAPYINQLRQGGASLREMYGVSHPSQGNYFAMFGGKVEGAADQCPVPGAPFSYENLASKLIAAGKTFGAYMQGYPGNPATCQSGNYVQRHAPWLNFSNVPASTFKTDAFPTDYTTLPTLSYVIPDNVNNMHSASITAGDTYLRNKLQGYAEWAKTHNSLLIVTWDESQIFNSVNDIETVFYGAHVKPGEYGPADTVTGKDNHYTMLRTLEDMYDLAHTQPPVTSAKTITALFDQTTGAPILAQPPDQTSVVNQADSYQLQGSGGVGARTYSATGLPPNMSVDQTSGLISGTPNATGTFNVTATVTDSASPPATNGKSFKWTVGNDDPGPIDIPQNFTLNPPPPGQNEQSGLAMSKKHPKTVYINPDGDNPSEVYAYSAETGQRKATLSFPGIPNTQQNDWEALAVGQNGIYVGAIGDNFANHANLKVYRVAEPTTLANASVTPTTFTLNYPDGAKDAESLLIDPTDNDQLYIASKIGGGPGKLYKAPNPLSATGTNNLTEMTGRAVPKFATDGAFSPDGKAYAIRSGKAPVIGNEDAAWIYRADGTELAKVTLPAQGQGEQITYYNCKYVLVGSEGDSVIRAVQLPAAAVPDPNCGGSSGPTVTNPGNQTTVKGTAVNLPIQVTGGKAPYTCVFTGLPDGLDNTGNACAVTGTPTTAQTKSVNVTATDADGKPAATSFSWTITEPGQNPVVTNPGNQSTRKGTAVNLPIQVTNGRSPYTCAFTGLPDGLNNTGNACTVTGTPTTVQTKSVTVTATDADGKPSAAVPFTWTITEPPTDGPVVTNPGNQTSKFNKSVFLQVKATGGSGALTFSATGLPLGLSMNSSGWITGKAWEVATKTVTVTVKDGAGKTGTATFTWTVTWF